MKISLKLVYQFKTICFNFPPTSNHLHTQQVENWDSNSRLVVYEDDNDKSLRGLTLKMRNKIIKIFTFLKMLPRSTTSSGWKLLICVYFETKYLQILISKNIFVHNNHNNCDLNG